MATDSIIIWGPESGRPDAVEFPPIRSEDLTDRGPAIIWNTRDPLFGRTAEEFEAAAREALAGRVLEAWFFGSFGTKEFSRDSDIDMMIVVETDKPFVERARGFPELFDLIPDLDLLVYTPEEFAGLTSDPSPGFWTSATRSMRRLL